MNLDQFGKDWRAQDKKARMWKLAALLSACILAAGIKGAWLWSISDQIITYGADIVGNVLTAVHKERMNMTAGALGEVSAACDGSHDLRAGGMVSGSTGFWNEGSCGIRAVMCSNSSSETTDAAVQGEENERTVNVKFTGSGAKEGVGELSTKYGVEYPFKINRKKGYTYNVSVRINGTKVGYDYDSELDIYYILSKNVMGDITIVISKKPTVEVNAYISSGKETMYLIVYNGTVNQGQIPKFENQEMYWSEMYHSYVWLTVSDKNEKRVKRQAEESIVMAEGNKKALVNNSGDVNLDGQSDEGDALLACDMYNGAYDLSDMEMVCFLNADIHGDRKVDIRDSAAIIHIIHGG